MPNLSNHNKKGLTMIEIITASLVIVALSGGLFGAFIGAQRFLNHARHRIHAYNLAVEAIDRLRSNYQYSDSVMAAGAGYHASDIGCAVSGEMASLMPSLDTDFTYAVEDNGYKQVTVTVHWNEPVLQ